MCVSRTGSFLAPCRQHGRRGGTRYATRCRAKQAAGKEAQPRSPLFEALEIRASEDAARQTSGDRRSHPIRRHGLGPGTRLCRMERLRAEIVMLSGLRGAQQGTASVEPRADQDRQGAGCFAAAPLPGDAARRLVPVAARDLRCGQPGYRRIDRPVHRHVRRRVLGSRGCKHPAERIRKRTNEG